MKIILNHPLKKLVLKYIVFMIPAMIVSAKGFADLWLYGLRQPYYALTLLVLSIVTALMLLTLASAFFFLARREFWIPPGRLIVLATGMKLYFDVSLGTTVGLTGVVSSLGLWLLWGILAYRKSRSMLGRS